MSPVFLHEQPNMETSGLGRLSLDQTKYMKESKGES